MRNPDRFERIVGDSLKDSTVMMISRVTAAKLLRKEHAATIKMIKRVAAWAEDDDSFQDMAMLLLKQLEQRRK